MLSRSCSSEKSYSPSRLKCRHATAEPWATASSRLVDQRGRPEPLSITTVSGVKVTLAEFMPTMIWSFGMLMFHIASGIAHAPTMIVNMPTTRQG